MYCNIEMNIMKNQVGSPGFGIQGKISMYMCFMCYDLALFIFHVLEVVCRYFCTGLKPTVTDYHCYTLGVITRLLLSSDCCYIPNRYLTTGCCYTVAGKDVGTIQYNNYWKL